eukprot:TRINITY_DN10125_c0_g1_i4.p1 TRINITY_DN10125_c0_g1~~TRINITY_DN10125_c0_g1_i4.p1  ORF type:complete len:327 (+),score=22.00 TRINITY_DN10125_c0_g1_i4:261-1241(+)
MYGIMVMNKVRVGRTIATGIALLGSLELWRQHRRQAKGYQGYDQPAVIHLDAIAIAKSLPLRALSRLWGEVANIAVPVEHRQRLWSWLDHILECHLEEYGLDFEEYACLQDVFTRQLPQPPSVAHNAWLVSPVDGVIQAIGALHDGCLRIKHHRYYPHELLGASLPDIPGHHQWYYAILYLRPGGYHHFHSPANWYISRQLHITGTLCPVSPSVQNVFPHALVTNERVVLLGASEIGSFAMTAIAAYNVGDIAMDHDLLLQTNQADLELNAVYEKEILAVKAVGQHIGHFRFGSTVCLLFSAPKDTCFEVQTGQKVSVGDALAFYR